MKYLLLLLLTFAKIANAQNNWAPIGATWIYTYSTTAGPPSPYCSIRSIGDTIILGKQCRVLQHFNGGCDLRGADEYMYSDSGKVYFFSPGLNKFILLYNFNAAVGEYYSTTFYNDSIVNVVDSVTIINVNGHFLKRQVTHVSHSFSSLPAIPNSIIVENMGNIRYMFNWIVSGCNEFMVGPLSCYSDSILGYYASNIPGALSNCSQYINSVPEIFYTNAVTVFPIPNTGKFKVTAESGSKYISVYNLFEQMIEFIALSGKKETISIDLSETPRGIYFVKIQTEKNAVVRKIVIE